MPIEKDSVIMSNYSQYFNISLSLTNYPKQLQNNDEWLQGIDTSGGSSTLVHDIYLTSSPALIQQDYFAQFFSMVVISAKGITYLE